MSHPDLDSSPSNWVDYELGRLQTVAKTEHNLEQLSTIGRTALWNAAECGAPSLIDAGMNLLERVVDQEELLGRHPSLYLESSLALACAPILQAWASGSSAGADTLQNVYKGLAVPIWDILHRDRRQKNIDYLTRTTYTALLTRQEDAPALIVPARPDACVPEDEGETVYRHNSYIATAAGLTACNIVTRQEGDDRYPSSMAFITAGYRLTKAVKDFDANTYRSISRLAPPRRTLEATRHLGEMIIDDAKGQASPPTQKILTAITHSLSGWPLELSLKLQAKAHPT